jgi:hypothetical protein
VKKALKRWFPLAVVAVVLAGCGGNGDPLGQVVGAAGKTLALQWVRYDLTFGRPRLFGPSIQIVGGRGAFNFKARLGYDVLDLQKRGGGSQLLWLDLTPTAFLVDPDPAPTGALPAGKVWISVGLSGGDALAGQAKGLAPELPLEAIVWGARTATHIRSTVGGHVPMDEYRVTVDLTRALSAARRAHLVALAAAIGSEVRAAHSTSLPMSVWVNGPGYVSRIDEVVPGSGLGAVSLVFTNFALRYTGALPPSSQIVPLASLSPGARSVWAVATGS